MIPERLTPEQLAAASESFAATAERGLRQLTATGAALERHARTLEEFDDQTDHHTPTVD
ncbi:hypothetical protein [Deinococcus soli (ex Cha et al. 2016)]|uniref:Uncharacterized protein n=1 Tax=Deinococcus soli (ex Cha et al. 2016) TaxID=1309411 RepID=A0ACC6KLQ1_9DEIO|nr:hypothetical protein [Deinococcus soli (ex Cha et al. 2016)]MDR6753433.1 hypothetical protein [Deinococcus soli (ex Cha et al. 2016)]